MKLAVDPENAKCTEVDALADDALVEKIASILNLGNDKHSILKNTLKEVYDEFMTGYYDVERSKPEHIERKALTEVQNAADALLDSLDSLFEFGNTDRRLAKALKAYDSEQFQNQTTLGIWTNIINDEYNPHFNLRRLIADIVSAAENASDRPDKGMSVDELEQAITKETDPKKIESLENELFFAEWANERAPNRHEEYKQRVKSRKTSKDLPIRNSIEILKNFFNNHVETPFTAGKYYPEIGFKSPAFYAVKAILEKIYPEASDRKTASIMQEIVKVETTQLLEKEQTA